MTSHRRRAARDWHTLAIEAPFVAAHRLTHELASLDPVRRWFGWHAVAWEKCIASAEMATALASATLLASASGNTSAFERLAGATFAPMARRVRRNSQAIRRARR